MDFSLAPITERIRAAAADQTPLRIRGGGTKDFHGLALHGEVLDTRPDAVNLSALDITVRRNAFGRQVDSFEEDLDFAGIDDGPVRAVFIRAPWVESVGAGVEVLATVPGATGDRICAVRSGSLIATSFHPELTGDHRVHALFADMVRRVA